MAEAGPATGSAGVLVKSQQQVDETAWGPYLQFLSEGEPFVEHLDSSTLDAVCQLEGAGVAFNSPGFVAQKRALEQDPDSDSDVEDVGKGAKRSKVGGESAAASRKACREKARREKLNEKFAELAKLIDPGNEPKSDKTTILVDAIKFVQQLTCENHQLKQLNKFLEERVGSYERERGQQLYQQSLMMNGIPAMSPGPSLMGALQPGPLPSMLPGNAMTHPGMMGINSSMSLQGMQGQHQYSSNGLASLGGPSTSSGVHPPPPSATPPLPQQAVQIQQQQQQQQSMQGSMQVLHPQSQLQPLAQMQQMGHAQQQQLLLQQQGSMPLQDFSSGSGGGPGAPKPVVAQQGLQGPSGSQHGNFQPMYNSWLPQNMLDSSQDSLLRPPAA